MKLFDEYLSKRVSRSCLVLVLLLVFGIKANAQEILSDYEIQQNFKKEYKLLNSSLDTVQSLETLEKIIQQIKDLEDSYEKHSELFNKTLYPETFSSEVEVLKKRSVSTQQRLTTIDKQNQRLDELDEKLANYETELDKLDRRTDSLRTAIQNSTQSEKEMSSLVRDYRNSLEQRDELILSIVDSVLVSYHNLNIESLESFEETSKQAMLSSDGNVLKMVETIALQNIEFLKTNPNLNTEDFLRMMAVQYKFEDMWQKVGSKLVNIYAENNKEEAMTNMQGMISTWDEIISTQTWSSISDAFTKADIGLGTFGDQKSFYDTLSTYVSSAVSESQGGSRTQYRNYQDFAEFWNSNVQVNWTPYLQEAGILTSEQMATIDKQLDMWAANAKPDSNMLVYLLVGSVLAIVILGVMLFREKSVQSTEKPDTKTEATPKK